MNTPTLDKMRAVQKESQAIGNFLEWLGEQGIQLAKTHEHDEECYNPGGFRTCGFKNEELYGFSYSTEKLLARYFEIDLTQADREKQAILDGLAV